MHIWDRLLPLMIKQFETTKPKVREQWQQLILKADITKVQTMKRL